MRTVGLSSAPKENVLRNAAGEQLTAEFLLVSPEFERIVLPYVQDLQKLGIKASVRMVDSAQYKRREDAHDYDIIVDNFAQSKSPGNEQRDFWGSAAADRDGSRNTVGIKNPAIDKLIDKIVFAKDRAELVAATRALDRVLLWNHYMVPQWHYPYERIATWDIFGRPETLPSQTAASDAGLVDRSREAEGTRLPRATNDGDQPSRRQALRRLVGAGADAACRACLVLAAAPAAAEPSHGLSTFGDLKYPADFKHFDYVNPDAPKGGTLSMIGTAGRTTFDSFNNFILKGDAAQGLEYLFDSLMARADDEPDAVYGLVAEERRGGARPHVGDVQAAARGQVRRRLAGHGRRRRVLLRHLEGRRATRNSTLSLRDVVKAEAIDPQTVRYTFKGELVRDLPLIVAGLPVLSKAYLHQHPFDQTSLERPLGSGPYEIGDFKPGTYVTYKRRARLLGQGPARQPRPLQFRRDPLRVLPRPRPRAAKACCPAPSICARSSPRRTGRPATTCRP